MRSIACAAVVTAALLLSACTGATVAGHGEPAGAGPGSGSGTSAGGRVASTTAELQSVLLGIDNVGGSGWAVLPDDATDSGSDSDSDPTCGSSDLTAPANEAEVDFSQGTLGPYLFQVLMSAPDSTTAKADYAKGIAAFHECSGVTDSDGSTYTVADMSFAKFGDQSQAFRITEVEASTASPGDDSVVPALPIDVVVIQDGRLIEIYLYVALTASDPNALSTAVKNGVSRAHVLQ